MFMVEKNLHILQKKIKKAKNVFCHRKNILLEMTASFAFEKQLKRSKVYKSLTQFELCQDVSQTRIYLRETISKRNLK